MLHELLQQLIAVELADQAAGIVVICDVSGVLRQEITDDLVDGVIAFFAECAIYRGPGIAPGKKSIAFSLELRADDRTLTDEDTTGVMNAVLEKLKNDLGVSLR